MKNSSALWSLPASSIMCGFFAHMAGFNFSILLTYLP